MSTQAYAFAISAPQELIDSLFPDWRTGTSVLRNGDGLICGNFWFKRSETGDGLELVLGAWKTPDGVVPCDSPADETRF